MRFSLASCAVFAALLAACSANQGSLSLPSGSTDSSLHTRLKPRQSNQVGLWYADTGNSYLFGSHDGNVVAVVDLVSENCLNPFAVKVDHAQNVWTACLQNNTPFAHYNGVVLEYGPTGSFIAAYIPACPTSAPNCSNWSSGALDTVTDGSHVFAALNSYSYSCTSSCGGGASFTENAGFEWWPIGKPSATPTLITPSSYCAPVCYVNYADVDNSGNLWFSYSGSTGGGLAEVVNPTSSPSVKFIEPSGTYGIPGGVFVSSGGTVLNVVDSGARMLFRYKLPLAASGKPFSAIGPTQMNILGRGEPVSGGFDKTDTKIVLGDGIGWLDVGSPSHKRWKIDMPIGCIDDSHIGPSGGNVNGASGCGGAAYSPSDK